MRRVLTTMLMLAGSCRASGLRAEPPADGGAQNEKAPTEIVVRGRRRPPVSSTDRTAASTVIPRQRLRSPGASAAEVLREVPGVRVSRRGTGTDLATASIRGATSAQTPVYLAGVRINDDVTGTADLSTLPLWMLDRVEVFRGSAPARADQLGIGGAIFFEPRFERRSTLGAGGELGSFGAGSGWVAASHGDGTSGVMASLGHSQADNDFTFVDDTGAVPVTATRRNADATTLDSWVLGRAALGRGTRLSALGHAFVREQGAPGLGTVPARRARMRTQRALGAVSTRFPCGRADDEERCAIDLSQSALLSGLDVDDPGRELSVVALRSESEGRRVAQRANLWLPVGSRLELDVGATWSIEQLLVDQDDVAVTRARRLGVRPSLAATLRPGEALELLAVGAIPCQATKATGAPNDGCDAAEPVGRIGAALALSPSWSLRGNVARSVRFPTLAERYGFSAVVRGSPDLAVETGIGGDMGVRFSPPSRPGDLVEIWADVFGFSRWADDLVAFRRSALGVVRPYNVDSARVLGLEGHVVARLLGTLENDLSVTLTDPRDTSGDPGNDLLPFQSRLHLADRLGATWDLANAVADSISGSVRVVHRASQFADEGGLVVIAAQTTVDFELATSWFDERLAIHAAVRNAFGARQFDTVGMPLPGRTVHLGGELWWR